MMRGKKYCSVFSQQCDSCLIRSIFDFVSPLLISPIKGICEKWENYDNPFQMSKFQMFLSLTLASVVIAAIGGYLPLIYSVWGQDTKECLQLLTEAFCCFLGFVAGYTNVAIPHLRLNNMEAWHKLIKKCKLHGYYKVATSFRKKMKRKMVIFKITSFVLPTVMAFMRLPVVKGEKFWLLRVFAVPFNVHLQLTIVFRNVLILQFLRTVYKAVHDQTANCLIKCTNGSSRANRNFGNCHELRELNRLYAALYFNSADFTEHISSKFTVWFGGCLLTLIIHIYSIVLLSNAEEVIQEFTTLKSQTILLIVIIIYLLNEFQRFHDVVSCNTLIKFVVAT